MVYPPIYHYIYKSILSITLIYNIAERLNIKLKVQVEKKNKVLLTFNRQISQMCNEIRS